MKNRQSKNTLKDLISRLDWTKIEVTRGLSSKLQPDKVCVSFLPENKKNPDQINRVFIRIGREVLEQLEWLPGDKIIPMFNPDDLMTFLLVKSDQGTGFTLGQESGVTSCKISFKWTNEVILDKTFSQVVEYEIYKKQLIFRVNS